MGLFAMYTGLIYNDIFSLSLNFADSHYSWPTVFNPGQVVEAIQTSSYYPFGLDPAWHGADNGLIYTNSLKMKMSIILGVLHVSFSHLSLLASSTHARMSIDVVCYLSASPESSSLQDTRIHLGRVLASILIHAVDLWLPCWMYCVCALSLLRVPVIYLILSERHISYKWSVDWAAIGRHPPNLLNMLIKMFLSPGTVSCFRQY